MKKLIYSLISSLAFAQNVKVTSNYGSENQDIQDLINFENIFFDKLNFQSENLKGKTYKIVLEEFKKGKLVKTSVLFDGSEADIFKIDKDKLSLKFAFKLSDGKLKTFVIGKTISGQGFYSKKFYSKLHNEEDDYALKNFLGSKEDISLDINKKNAIFAIITPTIHEDGTGSYCEVAQSDIAPEKLGEKFKISHYFLVSIKFN
ncbi:hypothetical protein [Epilithonimonas hungarica]|uniref:Uncharacterized protein n=1 Tax=Epilithonimonas hungarica TaxID=454006 RepID=A0A1G7HJ51_9FLAO|nr:hypothetical protein [Epilithonimonas hungarica]SDF00353.1 hypothetical protein SAMN05421825_0815 [Epilithonimonas hungarica]